jgi:hypothetical protein
VALASQCSSSRLPNREAVHDSIIAPRHNGSRRPLHSHGIDALVVALYLQRRLPGGSSIAVEQVTAQREGDDGIAVRDPYASDLRERDGTSSRFLKPYTPNPKPEMGPRQDVGMCAAQQAIPPTRLGIRFTFIRRRIRILPKR